MRIENNTVIFEDSDIQLFSAALQRAIQAHAGERMTPAEALSSAVNDYLTAAKETLTRQERQSLDEFVAAFANADEATRAEATVYLDQARVAVGVLAPPAGGGGGMLAKAAEFLGVQIGVDKTRPFSHVRMCNQSN